MQKNLPAIRSLGKGRKKLASQKPDVINWVFAYTDEEKPVMHSHQKQGVSDDNIHHHKATACFLVAADTYPFFISKSYIVGQPQFKYNQRHLIRKRND